MNVLFLFESVLPPDYFSHTTSPGELRVIAAQKQVHSIFALGPQGASFYDVAGKTLKTALEQKIHITRFIWPKNPFSYYVTWIGLLWHGWTVCRKNHIQVIHAESPHISGIAALILGKMFHTKVIVEYRVSYDQLLISRYGQVLGTWMRSVFWFIAGAVLTSTDAVAANSRTYMVELTQRFHLKRVSFYNPGVRVPVRFRKKIHKVFVVGYLARLYPDKGPMDFCRMVVDGSTWFRRHSVRFVVGGEGPELNKLKQFITKHNADDLISFKGTVDRWEFFQHIDLFVNTTMIMNALEMTLAEAACVGIPAIAYGKPPNPETVQHNATGKIVPVGDVNSLLEQTQKFVANKSIYLHCAKAAMLHGTHYQFEKQVNQITRIYRRLSLFHTA